MTYSAQSSHDDGSPAKRTNPPARRNSNSYVRKPSLTWSAFGATAVDRRDEPLSARRLQTVFRRERPRLRAACERAAFAHALLVITTKAAAHTVQRFLRAFVRRSHAARAEKARWRYRTYRPMEVRFCARAGGRGEGVSRSRRTSLRRLSSRPARQNPTTVIISLPTEARDRPILGAAVAVSRSLTRRVVVPLISAARPRVTPSSYHLP